MATRNMTHQQFIAPMECLALDRIPTGPQWSYELKLDGYRMEAIGEADRVLLYSRNGKPFNQKYPAIAKALNWLPAGTILDGELTAIDEKGRPRFQLLQNSQSAAPHLVYFVFDILRSEGEDLTKLPLAERREHLKRIVRPNDQVQVSESFPSQVPLLRFIEEHELEGIVAKRMDGRYEPGRRSGSWVKKRLNTQQAFVVGGYTPSHLGIDALVIGFYRDRNLIFAGRIRAGFNPQSRRTVYDQLKHLETSKCPFSNLPEARSGRWGEGMTAEKMKECRWLKPEAVAEIAFTDWTDDEHLRHASFVALREDVDPHTVVRG
jgi:DNA ligase D-like protein (predicted ligase)